MSNRFALSHVNCVQFKYALHGNAVYPCMEELCSTLPVSHEKCHSAMYMSLTVEFPKPKSKHPQSTVAFTYIAQINGYLHVAKRLRLSRRYEGERNAIGGNNPCNWFTSKRENQSTNECFSISPKITNVYNL